MSLICRIDHRCSFLREEEVGLERVRVSEQYYEIFSTWIFKHGRYRHVQAAPDATLTLHVR